MNASPPSRRRAGHLDHRLVRQRAVARRIALFVAALLVAALLGPYVASCVDRYVISGL